MIEVFVILTLQRPSPGGAQTITLDTKLTARPTSTPAQLYRYVRESVAPDGWQNANVLYYSATPNAAFGGAS